MQAGGWEQIEGGGQSHIWARELGPEVLDMLVPAGPVL